MTRHLLLLCLLLGAGLASAHIDADTFCESGLTAGWLLLLNSAACQRACGAAAVGARLSPCGAKPAPTRPCEPTAEGEKKMDFLAEEELVIQLTQMAWAKVLENNATADGSEPPCGEEFANVMPLAACSKVQPVPCLLCLGLRQVACKPARPCQQQAGQLPSPPTPAGATSALVAPRLSFWCVQRAAPAPRLQAGTLWRRRLSCHSHRPCPLLLARS